ncbi:MAG: DUF218 domain-containing protein [Halobacteriovoraceae bacterium]|nr:DUF218 domain-containing protein [Halobacteriovoraceae bacterium]MBT5093750.1 DUF218 domain-containing protein [Halobacteriovoraceae bacterium]
MSLISFVAYSGFCLSFILVSDKEERTSTQALFKKPPELIVVFTGDSGRIPYALKKAEHYNQSNIFITGVYSKNSVETLLAPFKASNKLNYDLLKIDYLARNTVENVIATLRHLRDNQNLKKVLIVSHDYHIMRIKLLMTQLKSESDDFEFYYSGVKTDYKKMRNIKVLYKEVFKLIRAYIFISFWDLS